MHAPVAVGGSIVPVVRSTDKPPLLFPSITSPSSQLVAHRAASTSDLHHRSGVLETAASAALETVESRPPRPELHDPEPVFVSTYDARGGLPVDSVGCPPGAWPPPLMQFGRSSGQSSSKLDDALRRSRLQTEKRLRAVVRNRSSSGGGSGDDGTAGEDAIDLLRDLEGGDNSGAAHSGAGVSKSAATSPVFIAATSTARSPQAGGFATVGGGGARDSGRPPVTVPPSLKLPLPGSKPKSGGWQVPSPVGVPVSADDAGRDGSDSDRVTRPAQQSENADSALDRSQSGSDRHERDRHRDQSRTDSGTDSYEDDFNDSGGGDD